VLFRSYVLEHKAPLAVTDAQTDERMAANRTLMRDRGTVSLLIIPIIVRGRVVGTIGLDAIERREFSEEEIALAQNVAAAAGQVLETARLYQALQRHAEQLQEMVAERTAELQVALTQAREADRVKSQFVSNVSHELRTPLTNLKLYLNLLTRGYPEKREIYLDTLQREADRLQYLIESLLDLSRLDLGKTRARLQPTDLNLLVSTLVTDRGTLAADWGLSLDVELEKTLPPALADRKLIERVLTNLLTNAINYTPTGGAVMLCTATAEKEAQKWVTFSVTDTGTGISQEEQRHLFERFYRGQAGRASDAPGTGLGLAISKAIVEQHGGRITVESQIGQGSIFTVWLYPA
jgi:signal transduction histidine kinase